MKPLPLFMDRDGDILWWYRSRIKWLTPDNNEKPVSVSRVQYYFPVFRVTKLFIDLKGKPCDWSRLSRKDQARVSQRSTFRPLSLQMMDQLHLPKPIGPISAWQVVRSRTKKMGVSSRGSSKGKKHDK